jgi:hypothetical protein
MNDGEKGEKVVMKRIENTLIERGEKYGEFSNYARICSELKMVCANNSLSADFCYIHEEALDMIFSKIARILSGDPNHSDNWHDIAGYATLVEKEVTKGF